MLVLEVLYSENCGNVAEGEGRVWSFHPCTVSTRVTVQHCSALRMHS